METAERQQPDPESAASLEERKHAADIKLRSAELELKRRESRFWRNPTALAVLALAGTIGAAIIQHHFELSLEERRSQKELILEHSRAQSSLILEAIKTGDPAKASSNLKFLIEVGLLDDPGQKITNYLNRKTSPVLPIGVGSFLAFDQDSIRILDRETGVGVQGALIVRRRDNSTCPPTDANGDSPCPVRIGERVDINAQGYQEEKNFQLRTHSVRLIPQATKHQ